MINFLYNLEKTNAMVTIYASGESYEGNIKLVEEAFVILTADGKQTIISMDKIEAFESAAQ